MSLFNYAHCMHTSAPEDVPICKYCSQLAFTVPINLLSLLWYIRMDTVRTLRTNDCTAIHTHKQTVALNAVTHGVVPRLGEHGVSSISLACHLSAESWVFYDGFGTVLIWVWLASARTFPWNSKTLAGVESGIPTRATRK